MGSHHGAAQATMTGPHSTEPALTRSTLTEGAGQAAKRILIVDDEPKIRSFIGRALSAADYKTGFAGSGSEGLRHALDEQYDLVTWGHPLAQRVQIDVATLMTAKTPAAVQRASAQLHHDQQALDAQRALIYQLITSASRSLSAHVPPPSLPS